MELDKASADKLRKVHPDLQRVISRAVCITDLRFIITESIRTKERQRILKAQGASQTMDSRHITGHAVDLAVILEGEVRWDWPLYYRLAKVIKEAARQEKVSIVWGGDWKRFKDGCHFELDRTVYP